MLPVTPRSTSRTAYAVFQLPLEKQSHIMLLLRSTSRTAYAVFQQLLEKMSES